MRQTRNIVEDRRERGKEERKQMNGCRPSEKPAGLALIEKTLTLLPYPLCIPFVSLPSCLSFPFFFVTFQSSRTLIHFTENLMRSKYSVKPSLLIRESHSCRRKMYFCMKIKKNINRI